MIEDVTPCFVDRPEPWEILSLESHMDSIISNDQIFVCLFQLASLSQKSVTDLISDTIVMEMM